MILAEKIIRLRKQFAWSQEELADKMNVSRQSVSKWESTNSIPDLNRIIALANLFGVTTDYLLKDEIDVIELSDSAHDAASNMITLDQANDYVSNKLKAAKITTTGVLFCVCSVVPLFLFLALAGLEKFNLTPNTATIVGIVLLLVMVSFGVSYFVKLGQFDDKFRPIDDEEFELAYGVNSIFKERLQQCRKHYQQRLSFGIALFITSSVPLIIAANTTNSGQVILFMVALMMFIIAAGLYLVIPVSAQYNAYNKLLKAGEFHPKKLAVTKRITAIAGIYWPLVIAIYLAWSLWTMAWGTTWIIWPVAAILFVALVGVQAFFGKKEN